uniref:ShKT domain-containing protein n=1 Tax=Parastrongyloides trichosuri TaxID=131310 RepID=A0A0N4ZXI7_PARTI
MNITFPNINDDFREYHYPQLYHSERSLKVQLFEENRKNLVTSMDRRIFIRLLKLILSSVLVTSSQIPQNLELRSRIASIINKTPCCIDRISNTACQRLYMTNPRYFEYECTNNADFAFVQCCRTCFDKKSSNGPRLNYTEVADELLTNVHTAVCYDKRGDDWCESFVKRNNFWMYKPFESLNCSNQAYAFRSCRASCGYCAIKERRALVVYDYNKAIDSRLCGDLKYTFARDIKKIDKNQKRYASEGIMMRKLMTRPRRNKISMKTDEIKGSVISNGNNYSNLKNNKLLRDQVSEKVAKNKIKFILSRGPLFYP